MPMLDLWGFADGKRAFFWTKHGKPDPMSIHRRVMAENNHTVDEFYRAAMSAGVIDNISPRAGVECYPGYYAADGSSASESHSLSRKCAISLNDAPAPDHICESLRRDCGTSCSGVISGSIERHGE
jgi:hypothetical protein